MWIPSIASEIINFLKRKRWKKVNRSILMEDNWIIMKMAWHLKKKLEQDKLVQHKSQACSKGYKQEPENNYAESFSTVATDSLVRTGIRVFLFYADVYKGVKYKIELIDIEAVFLEGELD